MTAGDKERPQFRRLSIGDLFLLTLCVSFAFALSAPQLRFLTNPDFVPNNPRWHDISREVADLTAGGVALFALTVLCRERLRGRLTYLSPGHWYFLVAGPVLVLTTLSAPLRNWLGPVGELVNIFVDGSVVLVVCFSLLVLTRGFASIDWQWRLCLSAVMLSLLITAVFFIWFIGLRFSWWTSGDFSLRLILAATTTAQLLTVVFAVIAVAIDVTKKVPRDWLHYSALIPLTLSAFSHALGFGSMTLKWWLGVAYYALSFFQ